MSNQFGSSQAIGTLYVSLDSVVEKVSRLDKVVQFDNVVCKDNKHENKIQPESK